MSAADTPRVAEFRDIVRTALGARVILGPTELNRRMGLNPRQPNLLGSPYTRVRIEEFESAGLVRVDGRWAWPS